MITEQQEEQASLYVLGALCGGELAAFEHEARANAELAALVRRLGATVGQLTRTVPQVAPPAGLKTRVMQSIGEPARKSPAVAPGSIPAGLAFSLAADESGWKALPVPGAFIKLLSFEPSRGYAVLLGKLGPGVRYPAHINAGPEDFLILTGDLHVSGQRLGPGDFHHADAGSQHEENYSVEGCTLMAVLTTDDPLVALATA
jgi:anti-sigma factor ChrR (cupin superfamily)